MRRVTVYDYDSKDVCSKCQRPISWEKKPKEDIDETTCHQCRSWRGYDHYIVCAFCGKLASGGWHTNRTPKERYVGYFHQWIVTHYGSTRAIVETPVGKIEEIELDRLEFKDPGDKNKEE
jgi:hypothetical protein